MTTQDAPSLKNAPETLTLDEIIELNGGEVIATDVPLEVYMQKYAEEHCEYIDGVVIKVAPQTIKHHDLLGFLNRLLDVYFELTRIGRVLRQPFVMRLPNYPNRRREPDLFIVLNSNPNTLKNTYMDGAADICIEVISEESSKRDRGVKFEEYEKGGVKEYWLLDSVRMFHNFYRLNQEGVYVPQDVNADQEYTTPLLPGLRIHVPSLWVDELPGPLAIGDLVRAMLKENVE